MYAILSMFFIITSCSKEETKQQENSIYSQWSLIKYEPGFSATENFSSEQITWTFEQAGVIQVVVDISVNTPPIKTIGEYNFSIVENTISIDNIEYDFSINKKRNQRR